MTTKPEAGELKPCPFCGCDDAFLANEHRDASGGWYVYCVKCDGCTGLRYSCGEDARPLVIEQWNRRASEAMQPIAAGEPTPDAEYVAQMEAFCESLINPTAAMLDAWQTAFARQLKVRKWYRKGWETTAEQAGAKAMIKEAAKSLELRASPAAPPPAEVALPERPTVTLDGKKQHPQVWFTWADTQAYARTATAYAAQQTAALRAELAGMREAVTGAASDVLAERQRQMQAEGWTPEHDDEHEDGALAQAAACYAVGNPLIKWLSGGDVWPSAWEYKGRGERRRLVKAGALILAEIERLDRRALSTTQPKEPQ